MQAFRKARVEDRADESLNGFCQHGGIHTVARLCPNVCSGAMKSYAIAGCGKAFLTLSHFCPYQTREYISSSGGGK